MILILTGNEKIAKLLIEHGARINEVDSNGHTALDNVNTAFEGKLKLMVGYAKMYGFQWLSWVKIGLRQIQWEKKWRENIPFNHQKCFVLFFEGHDKLIQLLEQHGAVYKGTFLLIEKKKWRNSIFYCNLLFDAILTFQVLNFTEELLKKVSVQCEVLIKLSVLPYSLLHSNSMSIIFESYRSMEHRDRY